MVLMPRRGITLFSRERERGGDGSLEGAITFILKWIMDRCESYRIISREGRLSQQFMLGEARANLLTLVCLGINRRG